MRWSIWNTWHTFAFSRSAKCLNFCKIFKTVTWHSPRIVLSGLRSRSTWHDFLRKLLSSEAAVYREHLPCDVSPPPPLSFSPTLTASCSLLWTVFLKKAVGNESARSKPAAECLLSQSICPPRGGDRGASLTLSPLFFSLLKSLLTVAARFKRLSLSVLPWGGN